MPDNHYYGCCACIGAAGIGLVPKLQLVRSKDGWGLNLFVPGTVCTRTPAGQQITFTLTTDYPAEGNVGIRLELAEPEEFTLRVRIPGWSEKTGLSVCGEARQAQPGYVQLRRLWHGGDTLTLSLDMTVRAFRPAPYGQQVLMNKVIWGHNYVIPTFDREDPMAARHIALGRGPLMLAQDNRLGYSVDDPIDVAVNSDGSVDARLPERDSAPFPHILEMQIPLADGSWQTLTDYASAGKLWTQESKMAVWLLTRD